MINYDILAEEVLPDDIDTSSLAMRNNLNPRIWKVVEGEYRMDDDIRSKLMSSADKFSEFIRYRNSSKFEITDIVVTGSNANYNWSEVSDLDVHLLLDYSSVGTDSDLISEYLYDKKILWSLKYDVNVKNIPVEFYAQDSNQGFVKGVGVYSILNDTWNIKPNVKNIVIDFNSVKDKAADIMNLIADSKTVAELDRIRDKIWRMRSAALSQYGEFAVENLVYKILRRNGTLDDLKSRFLDLSQP